MNAQTITRAIFAFAADDRNPMPRWASGTDAVIKDRRLDEIMIAFDCPNGWQLAFDISDDCVWFYEFDPARPFVVEFAARQGQLHSLDELAEVLIRCFPPKPAT